MKLVPFALLSLLAAQAAAASSTAVEHYRLRGQPDVASHLFLLPDGRFHYELSAGALDEQADGKWKREGRTIYLTTEPKPKPAVFSLQSSEKKGNEPFSLQVVWPDGRGVPLVDFQLILASGKTVEGYTQEDGWQLDRDAASPAKSVRLAVPMYGLQSPEIALDGAANRFVFLLTPNDLGIADFENMPLTVEKDRLIMHRGGSDLAYVREDQ